MASTASQHKITVAQAMHAIMDIDIHTSLNELVRKINWNEYSCIVVLDDEKNFFGIITQQDIHFAQKKKLNFNTTRAWEIASAEIQKVPPDTTLQDAIELMIDKQVRHLFIEEKKTIKGVITPLNILSLINWDEPRDITIPNYKTWQSPAK